MKATIKRLIKRIVYPIPTHLARNHIQVEVSGLHEIESAIKEHYHTGWRAQSTYSKNAYEEDLKAHLCNRLEGDRRRYVPWLDKARGLRSQRILEIGCGTGSSTVALAEQGARVMAIDIDEAAMKVAAVRCKVYGVSVDFRVLNAGAIHSFGSDAFDFIIFFACLEHMTVSERLDSLRAAWSILPRGGLLAVVETPNRLWYFDAHTSMLPFFHWLPHDLAFWYSKFSPREQFRDLYREYDAIAEEHFLRRGRGVSFHEFEIAIGPASGTNVIDSLAAFEGLRYRIRKSRLERRYKSLLMRVCPNIHEGFLEDSLNLIIEKK